MDIWGVQGVEAEAEVLSALVTSLQSMGLTSQDVGIKVSVIISNAHLVSALILRLYFRSIPRKLLMRYWNHLVRLE